MTSKLSRSVVMLLAALAAVALVAGPAVAQAPERLATQVTDPGGVLSDRAGVDAALAEMQDSTGIQLFVVLVDSFDGTPAQQWTDETARLSDLGNRDALLAVAVTDRAYAYSFPEDSRISDRELADVAANNIEPALSRSDWSGAVIAGAQGYTDAATGSSNFGWIFLVLGIIVVIVLAWMWLRKRRAVAHTAPAGAPAAPAGPTAEELTARANALLIELDDDLRAGERELALAVAQYGPEATAPFQAALESSRQDVAEAFRLRMTLDEVPAPDATQRRDTLTQIISLCEAADARLDAESEAFDRLRDLEGRAAEAATEIDQRRATIEAALPATEATLKQLTATYSGSTVTAIATNVDQARERLTFAATALTNARHALTSATHPTPGATPAAPPPGTGAGPATGAGAGPDAGAGAGPDAGAGPGAGAGAGPDAGVGSGAGAAPGAGAGPGAGVRPGVGAGVPGGDRAEAALAVRAAEQAVDQADQLVAAVARAAADLPAARSAADALINEITGEIAAGRAALTGNTVAPAGLTAAITGGEQALAEVRAAFSAERPDPVDAVARLQTADAALDAALAEARDVAERLAHDRSLLSQELPVARAEVAAANDFITTRRGAVRSEARATLSEAVRHLSVAESVATTDPATALAEARQARQLAANAARSANLDVQRWGGGPGYGGGWGGGRGSQGGFDAGAFAGAVLGGILSGGARSGGYHGGGFGGSASRGRRTSGGGGGGGRRGGGGRF
ncbi:TPM domain-containing protein [Actinoplanes sp. Pm04-4]|uniref:TPM domain-containing protein n=1 Tax=Paractinoplanes pyxinae TaxID=2997416 RepID=A0ABT4B8Y7_9ACTN|nr:TPM domain-containing protein [Actinoplanes pyxinae]MCY1142969.1 TPM domain-containing protein [Actinoplanes pyxinae]